MLCLLFSAISYACDYFDRLDVPPFGDGCSVERIAGWWVFGVLVGVPLGVGPRSDSSTIHVLERQPTENGHHATSDLARENHLIYLWVLILIKASQVGNQILMECGHYAATHLLHPCRGHTAHCLSLRTFSNPSHSVVLSTQDILPESFMFAPVLLSASQNQALSSH